MIAMSADMIVMSHDLYTIRQVDLFDLLPQYDSLGWHKLSHNVIQGVVHDSCKVTRGKGWYWFSRNIGSQNPIDLLILYYGLDFKAAIEIIRTYLNRSKDLMNKPITINRVKHFSKLPPKEAIKPWIPLIDYLSTRRCINLATVDDLQNKGILYQTFGAYHNLCFINDDRTHWEIVGMHPTKKYKQVSDAKNYWAYEIGRQRAYICESAIDAISLYELIADRDATYISIAGSVTRGRIIDRIITEYPEVILGVDNDDAGDKVAGMYPNLQRLKPKLKDFNDDLIKKKGELQ